MLVGGGVGEWTCVAFVVIQTGAVVECGVNIDFIAKFTILLLKCKGNRCRHHKRVLQCYPINTAEYSSRAFLFIRMCCQILTLNKAGSWNVIHSEHKHICESQYSARSKKCFTQIMVESFSKF